MRKIIRLTESELHGIIEKAIRTILDESATPILYHYIDAEHLLELLETNSFRTSGPEQHVDYDSGQLVPTNGAGVRFISFTRNPNPTEGYAALKYGEFGDGNLTCMCRLTIDGNIMNIYNNFKDKTGKRNKFTVKPFDWVYYNMRDEVGATNGKEYMMYSNDSTTPSGSWTDKGFSKLNKLPGVYDDKPHHPYSQSEDRLLSTAERIPNANKYIKCIDILLSEEGDDEEYERERKYLKPIMQKIEKRCAELRIPLKIHGKLSGFRPNNY